MSGLKKAVTASAIVVTVAAGTLAGVWVWKWYQKPKKGNEKDAKLKMMKLVSELGTDAVNRLPDNGSVTRMAMVEDELETIKVTVIIERRCNGFLGAATHESKAITSEQVHASTTVPGSELTSCVEKTETGDVDEETGDCTHEHSGEFSTRTNSEASSDTPNNIEDSVAQEEEAKDDTFNDSHDSTDDSGLLSTHTASEASEHDNMENRDTRNNSEYGNEQAADANEKTNNGTQDDDLSSISGRTGSGASEDLSIIVGEPSGIDGNDNDDADFVPAAIEVNRTLLLGFEILGVISEEERFDRTQKLRSGNDGLRMFVMMNVTQVRVLAVLEKLTIDTWEAWYADAKVGFNLCSPERGESSFVRQLFKEFVAESEARFSAGSL